MPSQACGLDTMSAMSFLSESVLIELAWDDEPEPFWRSGHVIGIVLPVKGVQDQAYLIVMSPGDRFPVETFLEDIRSIRLADQIEGSSHV